MKSTFAAISLLCIYVDLNRTNLYVCMSIHKICMPVLILSYIVVIYYQVLNRVCTNKREVLNYLCDFSTRYG
uniref:Putative ovule protein n=1 Tax=Solanum chacoense TaxID=4108 RepID=A0A0V0HRF1_SOLCH